MLISTLQNILIFRGSSTWKHLATSCLKILSRYNNIYRNTNTMSSPPFSFLVFVCFFYAKSLRQLRFSLWTSQMFPQYYCPEKFGHDIKIWQCWLDRDQSAILPFYTNINTLFFFKEMVWSKKKKKVSEQRQKIVNHITIKIN